MTDFIPFVVILDFHLSLSSILKAVRIFLRGEAFGLSGLESDGKWDSHERRLLAKTQKSPFLKLLILYAVKKDRNCI